MKNVLKITLASALVLGSFAASSQQALANGRHHHHDDEMACSNGADVLPILFVGAALGAVTGGVGSAVIWGSAYAVGGAAVGGAGGLLLATHDHRHHDCM